MITFLKPQLSTEKISTKTIEVYYNELEQNP